jgi:sugar phosphate isomerase/epimerase
VTELPVAFSTLAFPDTPLPTALSLGRSYGYQGVELRLIDGALIDPFMPAGQRAAVQQTIAAAGLPVVAVDSSVRLTSDDPGPELQRFLELASDWEAPLVRVFGGELSAGPERAGQQLAAARVLQDAVPTSERLGVAIGVETHDSFSASSVLADLLALVRSDWVGAVWDSHHPHRMGDRPAEVYQRLGERIRLAQVKDARRDPGRADGWQLVLLGAGEVPVREMLGLLAEGGYQGWISVEWEKRWHPEIEPAEVALPQHLKLLTEWMRDR